MARRKAKGIPCVTAYAGIVTPKDSEKRCVEFRFHPTDESVRNVVAMLSVEAAKNLRDQIANTLHNIHSAERNDQLREAARGQP